MRKDGDEVTTEFERKQDFGKELEGGGNASLIFIGIVSNTFKGQFD